MAFEANEYGRSVAAPGLIFADQPYSVESRVIAPDNGVDLEGGFPLFAKVGEDVKVYKSATAAGEGSVFLGIAQRLVHYDSYPAGTPVNVVTFGRMWVKVAEDVQSGTTAKLTSAGAWGAAGTELKNVTYKTSAKAGGYAVVEIK